MGRGKKRNTAEFIDEAKKVHSNKYDYVKTCYLNKKSKVIISCLIHGDFEQNAHNHLQGNGCPLCGEENSLKKRTSSKDIFIKKANIIHGNKFNYEHVKYINSHSYVEILCEKHGIFKQKPYAHLTNKQGCPGCYNVNRKLIAPSWTITNWISASKRSKTFDSFKLYVIRCYNETEDFIKIGRTYNTMERRFSGGQLPYNYEVLKIIKSDNGEYIYNLENRVKRKFNSLKYEPKIKFGGMNECFKF
jgi:hypothetical protein